MAASPERLSYTEQQLVMALYRAVFDRSPDEEGLQRHSEALRTKAATPKDLARTFFHSDEHVLKMCGEARLRDYSQFGELKHVLAILTRTGSRFQFLVDVGARGRDRSNSYNLLCDFGWRGLLIDANPALIDRIDEEFDGLDFQLVNCAVGDQTGKLPFYIGANDDVSSLLADHAEAWGALRGTVEVDVRHLPIFSTSMTYPMRSTCSA